MNDLKASNLTISSFRGINHQINLDLKDFTIICGENGTGKSSIVNSLEYLFSGKLNHLSSSTIKKSSFVNKNSKKKDVYIELSLDNGEYYVLKGTKKESSPVFKTILDNPYMNQASFILNRKKLLEFIEGSQGNRYDAIIDLCGIKTIEKVQKALSPSIKQVKAKFQDAIALYSLDLEKLDDLHNSKDSTLKTKLDMKRINDSFSKDIEDLKLKKIENEKSLALMIEKNEADFKNYIDQINELLKSKNLDLIDYDTDVEEYKRNLDFSSFLNLDAKITEFNKAFENINLDFEDDLKNVLNEYENIASENLKSSRYLVKTLKTSIEFINLSNCDICPICNNDIDSNEVVREMENKINEINSSNIAFDNWQRNLKSLKSVINSKIKNLDKLNDKILEINDLQNKDIKLLDYSMLNDLNDFIEEFSNFKKTPTDFNQFDFNQLNKEIISIKEEIDSIEVSQDKDDYLNILEKLTEVKLFEQKEREVEGLRNLIFNNELEINQKTNQIEENKQSEEDLDRRIIYIDLEIKKLEIQLSNREKNIEKLEKKVDIAEKTFDIFVNTKKEFIENMFSNISDYMGHYYDFIHSDDLISSPEIVFPKNRKMDVNLYSFDESVDSRSFASEGHLDTLGICIFLAFNKQFSDLPLIVLDDVLTTIDEDHKEKIVQLLFEEFSDYQFLITAHNKPWVDSLEELCLENGNDCSVYEIDDWTLEYGPEIHLRY